MKKAWCKADPALLEQLQTEVNSVYPNLRFVLRNEIVVIKGSFPVIHEGRVLDRYNLEIELSSDYPDSVPTVREVGGRIPRVANRHMRDDGEACLFLPDERWRVCPPGSSLLNFLKGAVHNFFLGQSLVERGQPWPFGEWGHGGEGVRQYYAELCGTDDISVILKYLEYLSRPEIKGHWECPCGSKKRLRNCHSAKLNELRKKIPPSVAKESLRELLKGL